LVLLVVLVVLPVLGVQEEHLVGLMEQIPTQEMVVVVVVPPQAM
jgi:hypothetical protein